MPRIPPALAATLLLTSCATLPAVQTEAFDKLAQADRDAFRAAVVAERDAVRAFATNSLVEGKGTLVLVDCDHLNPKGVCRSEFTLNGALISTAEVAPEASRLIGSVARYGAAMKELGAAKDLEALNGRIDGAAAAIGGLLTASGVGGVVAPLAMLGAEGLKGAYKEKRRLKMLQLAREADPAVRATAGILTRDVTAIKSGILGAVGPRLTGSELELPQNVEEIAAVKARLAGTGRPPTEIAADQERLATLRQRVRYLVDDQFEAAAQTQGSRGLKGDFSSLSKAHATLLSSLEDPKANGDASLAAVNGFLADLKDLKAAL